MRNMLYVKKNKKIIPFFVIFLLVFNIKLKFIPVITSNIFFAFMGIFVISLQVIKKNSIIKIPLSLYKFVCLYCFLLFYILFVLILNNSTDLSFFKLFAFNLIITFFAAYFCVFIIYKYNLSLKELLKIFVDVYLLQMLIVIVFFFNKSISFFILSFIDWGAKINGRFEDLFSYRAFGIAFGFDMGTADLTCAMLCCIYLYLEEKKYIKYLFIFLICSLMGIFVARTMFLGIGVCGLMFLTYPCKYKFRKIKSIILIFLILGIGFLLLFFLFDFSKYMRSILWVFDVFIQLFTKGKITGGSVSELTGKMLFYPGDKAMCIGDGLYHINERQYRDTDIGYLRLILYFGIPGLVIFLFFLKNLIFLCFSERKTKGIKKLCSFIFLFQLIFLYKIYYIMSPIFFLFSIYAMYPKISGRYYVKYCNDHL